MNKSLPFVRLPVAVKVEPMLPSYSAYIENYLLNSGKRPHPVPGEHHFVSAYLVPTLFRINRTVPDYINPDGTKAILGDVVYYRDGKHDYGIEVKLRTVRLTKREFNTWIVAKATDSWPHLFVGVGGKGIGLSTWSEFHKAYLAAINARRSAHWKNWRPKEISSGYGPMVSVDVLLEHLPPSAKFLYTSCPKEAKKREKLFTQALHSHVSHIGI